MANFNLELATINLLQSGSLYLQSAGSDGADNTIRGVDLRWALGRELGDNHFPKGLYSGGFSTVPAYQCNYGFNIERDFVILMRIRCIKGFPTQINIDTVPDNISTLPDGRPKWEYNVTLPSPHKVKNTLYIIFDDISSYTTSYDTNIDIANPDYEKFYLEYMGVLNIGVLDKLSYSLGIDRKDTNGTMEIETVSQTDTQDPNNKIISSRKILKPPSTVNSSVKIDSENIEYFRLRYSNGDYPVIISLETYSDFIKYSEDPVNPKWKLLEGPTVGTAALTDFALSIEPNIINDRLNTSNVNNFNNRWPKYNDTDTVTGKFAVKVSNYADRWGLINDDESLQHALDRYFILSALGDTKAIEIINAVPPDNGSMAISYFEFLKFASLDYHCARMLGFGYIDEEPPSIGSTSDKYIYFAMYQSLDPNDFETAITHGYMTLPTSMKDYRLPPPPVLTHLSYGISMDDGSGTPVQMTNATGYAPNEQIRYINIHKDAYKYDEPLGPFFQRQLEFNLGEITRPVLYGVEYKEQSASSWIEPELSNDEEFLDNASVNETVPIAEQPNPIFTHEETEEGIHGYAMYSINWFSRVSELSNILKTDYTQFQAAETLLPPLNLTAKLIQPEDVLLLTTEDEQDLLSQLSGDKTLVRVTFDYNHNHHINYQFGERIQFFFRENLPANVKGKITNVIDGLSENRVAVETGDFVINSVIPQQTVIPILVQSDFDKFIGGLFAVNERQFIINDIIETDASGINPTFILKKIKSNEVIAIPGSNDPITGTMLYQPIGSYIKPNSGDLFMAIENASNQGNWQNKLSFEVNLQNFTPPHIESYTELDGSVTETVIGGIIDDATISNIADNAGQPTNFFLIQLQTVGLSTLSPPEVNWHKGIVRAVNNDSGPTGPQMREYEVVEIKKDAAGLFLNPLQIVILDSEYDPSDPGSIHIQNSGTPEINFHPSYKVYLYSDATNSFDENHILPNPGHGIKKTYLAARTVDTTPASGQVSSYLTMPVEITAREIIEPLPPLLPQGPEFATRPDFYGKSTYTFDNEVVLFNPNGTPRVPFAYLFYRSSDNSILHALYKPDTVEAIVTDLKNLEPADGAFNSNRWSDLVNIIYDTATNTFNEYIPGGYRFPLPDKDNYSIRLKNTSGNYVIINPFSGTFLLNDTIAGTTYKVIDFVLRAIRESFTSLSEFPAVYKYIRNFADGFPTSKAPQIRDNNGNLIAPSSNDYNPTPMVAKYESGSGETYLRFTDYGLDGASKSQYFYYAAEMSNTLKIESGPIAGPISMVNSYPADPPRIKKISTQLQNSVLGIPSAVKIELNSYLENEGIKQFQLYRAFDKISTMNLRSMQPVGIVPIDNGEIILTDTFSNMNAIPYGDIIYYRAVAYREIINENSNTELIASMPSDVAVCNVIDVINPQPPEILTNNPSQVNVPPPTLQNVILSWLPTCYNGTYYLYKMNSSGNWNLLFTIKSNDPAMLTFAVGDLLKENGDGIEIYHRFRVKVENSSGLFNLIENELTL